MCNISSKCPVHLNVQDVWMLEKYVVDYPDVRSQDPRIHSPPHPMTSSESSNVHPSSPAE